MQFGGLSSQLGQSAYAKLATVTKLGQVSYTALQIMGANQSNLTNQSITDESISAKLFSRHGFQILRVHPNSPVSEANVSPYFDYIIAINGVEVVNDTKY